MTTSPPVVGVDVAKERLDIAIRPSGERWSVANDDAGVVSKRTVACWTCRAASRQGRTTRCTLGHGPATALWLQLPQTKTVKLRAASGSQVQHAGGGPRRRLQRVVRGRPLAAPAEHWLD